MLLISNNVQKNKQIRIISGRYLNFLLAHPLSHKRGMVMEMVNRYLLLSHSRYHNKNFKFIINTLLENDYFPEFIFKTINSRLKTLFHKQSKALNNTTNSSPKQRTSWFVLSYIKSVSDKFKSIISNLNMKVIFFSLNKFGSFVNKDVPKESNKNVVKKSKMQRLQCDICRAN